MSSNSVSVDGGQSITVEIVDAPPIVAENLMEAQDARNEAVASAAAAATSEANASTSETNATTSETNAANSETNAANSATTASTAVASIGSSVADAANSATAAAASATSIEDAETTCTTAATNAANSATAAATSETNAADSETAAAASETNSATSETNASNSATAAATSATNAANSATTASTAVASIGTSVTDAANSATAAAASATSIGNAETTCTNAATNALNSETVAATSETNAANSAVAAATSATNAGNSETASAASEVNAGNSETAALASQTATATSETNAANSAAAASTSETNAATSEANAANSATAAASDAGSASSSKVAAEAALAAVTIANNVGHRGFMTKAAMDSDLNHDANTLAEVTNDGANNGTYIKQGASGAGSWLASTNDVTSRVSDLETRAVKTTGGEVQEDVSFAGKQKAPGNDLTDGDETVTRDLGDDRYWRRTNYDIVDDFVGGGLATEIIGDLGWTSSPATPVGLARILYGNGNPGQLSLKPELASIVRLQLPMGLYGLEAAMGVYMDWGFRLHSIGDGVLFLGGWRNDDNYYGLVLDVAVSPNWIIRTSSGGSVVDVDTGHLATTGYYQVRIDTELGQVKLYDAPGQSRSGRLLHPSVLFSATFALVSTGHPTNPTIRVNNVTASSQTDIWIDYFRLHSRTPKTDHSKILS